MTTEELAGMYAGRNGYHGADDDGGHDEPGPAGKTTAAVVPLSLGQLRRQYPSLRQPVIHGLLRQGETANVVAAAKVGKSFLSADLAISVAAGTPWLGRFDVESGEVLIIDNELHHETTASRLPLVAKARGVPLEEIDDRVHVANLRGKLLDIVGLGDYFGTVKSGRFRLVLLDALYKFLPQGTDENSNGQIAQVFTLLDSYAERLNCAVVVVHHSSKGLQSGKAVTDVGSGAGSQSRSVDSHVVLRPHSEDGVTVLDASCRSWPPIQPLALRWQYPVFNPTDDIDPAKLAGMAKPRGAGKDDVAIQREIDANAGKLLEWLDKDDPEGAGVQVKKLASRIGWSRSKVDRAVQRLEDSGVAEKFRGEIVSGGGGKQGADFLRRLRSPP